MGKSTLLNALLGEKLSIITNKPQTTRHRILAIANDENYQIVFSDTPGIIADPSYRMQEAMNRFVQTAFEDADVLLYMIDVVNVVLPSADIHRKMKKAQCPKYFVLNKIDLTNEKALKTIALELEKNYPEFKIVAISAKEHIGVSELLKTILKDLPEGPPYYPKDQFTDRPERFFVSEIIREKILQLYHQEIPYSCEVIIDSFKEDNERKDRLVRIGATIIVNRKTQKSILIGKGGVAIKKLGTESRKEIESFLERKVFLELYVKVKEKWRDDERSLKSYGYLH